MHPDAPMGRPRRAALAAGLALGLGLGGRAAGQAPATEDPAPAAPEPGGAPLSADPAEAPDPDGLSPTAVRAREAAREAWARGDARAALASWTLVLSERPELEEALLGLALAQEARGELAAAARSYGRLPQHPEANKALGRLRLAEDPEQAAAAFTRALQLLPEDPEASLGLARARATADPAQSRSLARAYLCCAAPPIDTEGIVEISVAWRDLGMDEDAAQLLREALARDPEGPRAAELRGRIDRIQVERAARGLALGGSRALPPAARAELEAARAQAAAGQAQAAAERVDRVLVDHPSSAEARATQGDLLLQEGEVAKAEQAWGWAVALDPEQPEWRARLGMLLADRYAGRRHAEAAEHLRLATQLRPGQGSLHLRLAEVLVGLGRFEDAEVEVRAALAAQPEPSARARAAALLEDLERAPPPVSAPPAAPEVPEAGAPPAAVQTARVARVYLDRGDIERAKAELIVVRTLAPEWTGGLNLAAGIALREGALDEAEAAFRRSLAADPAQPQVELALADLLALRGAEDEAAARLERAAEGGAVDARWALAQRAWSRGQLLEANRQLRAYFASAPQGITLEPARSLQRQVQRRIQWIAASVGAGIALLTGILFARRRAAARRTDLARLVQHDPELAPTVARLLTAIRHEVLKHNTTLLDEVAHAVEHGDHHAATFAAGRLFGPPDRGSGGRGGPTAGEGGVLSRFRGYIDQLSALAARAGLRLDVPRDPVLGPLCAHMDALADLAGPMRSPADPAALSAALRRLSLALNGESYRALGHLVRRLGALRLEAPLIQAVDARVRAEPQLAHAALPPLSIDIPEDGVPVRILKGDLEDVLANLLRNAAVAVREAQAQGAAPGRLGLHVEEEDDAITGMESVNLRVLDDAPGELTESMIRGREAGRGLGLVVDLVTRHDGSLSVERRPDERAAGYTKAVVVRLQRAELESA